MSGSQSNTTPVARTSADLIGERLEALRDLIPEAFTEGKIDFDKLRTALGDVVDTQRERYSFTWAGKQDAIRLLQTPTRATLVPAKEESVNWDTTQNLFIEGDNLEVLKLLYKAYYGRVKLIYIDPPYNTGNDFIYPDDYADPLRPYLQLTGQMDNAGNLLTSNTEASGRYHSAWLNMMYPRLFVARQLLQEDGAIFVSIDDGEVQNLRLLMNLVFGEENFIGTVIWQKVFAPKNTARHFSEDHDYIVIFARNAEIWDPQLLPRSDEALNRYQNSDGDNRGTWSSSDLTARNYYSEGLYTVESPSGKLFKPTVGTYWRVNAKKFKELDDDGRIWWGTDGNNMPRLKRFLSDVKDGVVPQTLWKYADVGHTQEAKKELLAAVTFHDTANVLNTVKPTRLLRRILQIATTPGSQDIVVDFFAGSAPTAHALLEQNDDDNSSRRFICIQLPEPLPKPEKTLRTIADIGKDRIRSVMDRHEVAKDVKNEGLSKTRSSGFRVFKLSPSHFTNWSGTASATPADYYRQLEAFTDPLTQHHDAEAVLWEVAIKEGYSLTSRVEAAAVAGHMVYRVIDPDRDQHFHICLDDSVAPELAAALGLGKEDLFVCRDLALDDSTAANLALQCRLKTI